MSSKLAGTVPKLIFNPGGCKYLSYQGLPYNVPIPLSGSPLIGCQEVNNAHL